MSTQLTLTGIVLDQGTKERLSGATVKLKTPTKVLFEETDKDGRFVFENVDEPPLDEEVAVYTVYLSAYYKEGRQQEPTPTTIDIEKSKERHYEEIEMVNRGPISNSGGIAFLAFLVVILVALLYWYYSQHKQDVQEGQQQYRPGVVNILTESLVDRITADSVKVSAFKLKADSIDTTDLVVITAELLQIEGAVDELFKSSRIDTAYQALIYRNLEDVKQAIESRNKDDVQAALISSKAYIAEIPALSPGWFWNVSPLIYCEILFWALFATLLRLISNTSYFVSRNIFYRDSILHKAVLLFTIPLIALMITFIISFFKVGVWIGEKSLTVDFSDPYVAIILAFMIGLAPWKSWEFVYGLADKLFNELNKWLVSNKPGEEESGGGKKDKGSQKNKATDDPEEPDDSAAASGAEEPDDSGATNDDEASDDSSATNDADTTDDSSATSDAESANDTGPTNL